MTGILKYNPQRDFTHLINSCMAENWVAFYTTRKAAFHRALERSVTLTAYEGGEYCGFMRCITDGFYTVYCCELIVERPYRRRGIAEALVNTLCDALKERGSVSLTLEVRASNEPAKALYEKLGFEQVGRRPNYYRNPKEDALILKKML